MQLRCALSVWNLSPRSSTRATQKAHKRALFGTRSVWTSHSKLLTRLFHPKQFSLIHTPSWSWSESRWYDIMEIHETQPNSEHHVWKFSSLLFQDTKSGVCMRNIYEECMYVWSIGPLESVQVTTQNGATLPRSPRFPWSQNAELTWIETETVVKHGIP